MLLIESGPRCDSLRLIPMLRHSVCGEAPIDLFTCLPDDPEGLGANARSWRTYNASTHSERWQLLLDLRRGRHGAVAILCSDSPLLAVWKLVLAAMLPAKVLLVDQSEGLFWLELAQWRKAARLAVSRSGIRNPELIRKVAHLAFLPFGLCVLVGFAAKVHLARLARLMRPGERADESR